MKVPETKRQVRILMGFFRTFLITLKTLLKIAEPLTDLTGKRIPSKENKALELLTTQLCKAIMEPMQIVDFNKSYAIEVDSSGNTIGAVLLQLMLEQGNKPVAFASQK